MTSTRMSYVHSPMRYNLTYFTIPERLKELGNKLQEKEIYVFVGQNGERESITASALCDASTNVAKLLVKLGLKKGDVVASCIPNNLDSLVCTLGIICAGGVVLNRLSQTDVSSIKDSLIKTRAKGLILDPGNDASDLEACLEFVKDKKGEEKLASDSDPSLAFLLTTKSFDNLNVINVMKHGIDVSDVTLPRIDPEDFAVLFTTSGSTGLPKFVPQSHHAAMIVGYQLEESMLFDPDDVIYTERKLAWIGGFPYMYFHNGVKTVTKTTAFASLEEHCKFTATTLENENCTIACIFPVTVIGLTDIWNETRSPKVMLKNMHVGAVPVADVCMGAIGRYAKAVTNVYGSSEGGFLASNIITNKTDFESYCCGIPSQGVEIKIVDDNGVIVPRGENGVIHVRAPSLLWQYLNDHEKTKEVLSASHWMDTDDIGYISADGKLTVCGRKSDIILQAGKYFVPTVVEAYIKSHPDVLDAIVVSIPDVGKFALVCACVIGKPGRCLEAKTIRDYFDTKYKYSTGEAFCSEGPEHVLIYEDYPKLYTGKPDKKRLREDAMTRLKQQVKR